jgi:hypothetical protein
MEVSMKGRALSVAVLMLGLLVAWGCSQPPAAPKTAQPAAAADARLVGSYRFDRGGWIFVHLEGPPATLGFQHGYLLAAETADLLRVFRGFTEHQTKKDWAFFRTASEQILWPKMDAEYQQEIDGIVAGLNAKQVAADRWDIVALNAIEELPDYYVPWLEKQQDKKPTQKAPGNCSAFVATGSYTKDGKIVIAHNNWTTYVTGSRWNIVFDLKPEKGYAVLMDGLPGVIVSDDDFGINANGIMVTETTITGFELFDPSGVPEFMRARKALQYAGSIDDFVRIMLDGNNGAYANDWLVGDNKTGEIARFELGLKEHTVERTRDGFFVGSNFPVGEKLIRNETTFDRKKKDSSPNARRARWEQLMAQHKGKIDIALAREFEGDKYDVIEKKDGPTERTLCGLVDASPRGVPEWNWPPYYPGGTVQSKATDGTLAQSMQMWAAMGHQCAPDFKAEAYLQQHPEYGWARALLRDMPTGPWTLFTAGGR